MNLTILLHQSQGYKNLGCGTKKKSFPPFLCTAFIPLSSMKIINSSSSLFIGKAVTFFVIEENPRV